MATRTRGMAAVIFVIAFVINPALFSGCDRGFKFGEAEMLELVASVNRTARWTFTSDGTDYELTVALEQVQGGDKEAAWRGAAVRSAYACSERSFMRSAGACLDTTELPVKGTLTIARLDATPKALIASQPVEGTLEVIGKRLERAELTLQFAEDFVRLDSKDARTFQLKSVNVGGDAPTALRYSAK